MRLPPGTDIVDLHTPANQRSAANANYARRVLSASERAQFQAAGRAAHFLWLLWSAKEAAYKSLSPQGQLVFSHRRFEVHTERWRELHAQNGCAAGVVRYQDRNVPVRWRWNANYVHAISGGALGDEHSAVGNVWDILRDAGMETAYPSMPRASHAARTLAHRLLEQAASVPQGLVITRSSRHAPQILRDGDLWPDMQISLSHDGRFVAATVSRCRSPTEPDPEQ